MVVCLPGNYSERYKHVYKENKTMASLIPGSPLEGCRPAETTCSLFLAGHPTPKKSREKIVLFWYLVRFIFSTYLFMGSEQACLA
jgi:hypothetical protein